MPVPVRARYTITVQREEFTGENDAHGNPIYEWVSHTVPVYGWATPGRPSEPFEEGRPYLTVEHLDVYGRADLDVRSDDRVIIEGRTWAVATAPETYVSGPFGGPGGRRVTVKVVSG